MVRRVTIKNFKSIEDLSIDLGRCTVFIGANGSGKSNILEAIALASAAAADKLDNEFLASRGIRVTDTAAHMTSAFASIATEQSIEVGAIADDIDATSGQIEVKCSIAAKQNGTYIQWVETDANLGSIKSKLEVSGISSSNLDVIEDALRNALTIIEDSQATAKDLVNADEYIDSFQSLITRSHDLKARIDDINRRIKNFRFLESFVIYALDPDALRTFERQGQILPLGIRGEGLFRLLKSILAQKDDTRAKQIKESLRVIDWFSDFSLPDNLMSTEYSLQIRDRYLADDLAVFDQRSTNEGFLYLLFYFTLFCAEETPKFFAIDNIDDSLNPRLSAETIKNLVQLAKQHDKQFLATTHQPGLLDGINLLDPDQFLYVVYRDIEGRTSVKRVKPPRSSKHDPVRLSEAFIRGYLGGLPVHF